MASVGTARARRENFFYPIYDFKMCLHSRQMKNCRFLTLGVGIAAKVHVKQSFINLDCDFFVGKGTFFEIKRVFVVDMI